MLGLALSKVIGVDSFHHCSIHWFQKFSINLRSSLMDLLTVRVFFSLKVFHFIMKINAYLHVESKMLKWGLATNGPLVPTLLGCLTSYITLFFAFGTCLKRFSSSLSFCRVSVVMCAWYMPLLLLKFLQFITSPSVTKSFYYMYQIGGNL